MNVRVPSLLDLRNTITSAVQRFPLVFLFSVIGCVVLSIFVHQPDFIQDVDRQYVKAILSCLLAFPLFISFESLPLTMQVSVQRKWILRILGLLFIGAFYYFTPIDHMESVKFITRFIGFNLVFHLLVAFIPFINQRNDLLFWEYNKTLFLNFIQGVFYTVSAGIGLMLALLALDKLFGIHIEDEVPMTIWVWLLGFVNTIYFLSHFPKRGDVSENLVDMPKPLFIFLKYVLVPLVMLYFVILYAYTGKITVQWTWPEGWISKLILGFSIMGILGFLLSFPKHSKRASLSEDDILKSPTLVFFGRYYFFILLPMCVVLLLAIQRRINEYGVTEVRFFAAALAVWLLLVTAYMVFSKKKHIIFLPVSLALLTILSIMGPFNAYQVSVKNQMNRLVSSLNTADMIKEGVIQPSNSDLSIQRATNIRTALSYLENTNQMDRLNAMIPESMEPFKAAVKDYENYNELLTYLDLPKSVEAKQQSNFVYVQANMESPISIEGYDQMQRFYLLDEKHFKENTNRYEAQDPAVFFDQSNDSIFIRTPKNGIRTKTSIKPLINQLKNGFSGQNLNYIPRKNLTVDWTDQETNYRITFDNISYSVEQDAYVAGNGWMLWSE